MIGALKTDNTKEITWLMLLHIYISNIGWFGDYVDRDGQYFKDYIGYKALNKCWIAIDFMIYDKFLNEI